MMMNDRRESEGFKSVILRNVLTPLNPPGANQTCNRSTAQDQTG